MKKKIWPWLFLSIIIVVIVYFSWVKFVNTKASAGILSEFEAKALIQERYQGTVTQIELSNEQYSIKLEKQKNIYSILLDAKDGKVLSVTKTKTGAASPNHSQAPVTKMLTETEAKQIAEKQVNGVVNQILLETKGGISFYLIEIRTQDDQEAVVQIHAFTGNVMSLAWDDHHNEDDTKDDDTKDRKKSDDD
jgi:uncharacterized membrane protein YkoI